MFAWLPNKPWLVKSYTSERYQSVSEHWFEGLARLWARWYSFTEKNDQVMYMVVSRSDWYSR